MKGREKLAGPMAGAVAAAVAVAVQLSGVLAGVEDATVDQRFRLRPAHAPSSVAVIAIDERSFDILGQRPPLPRSLHARLLDRLRVAHPRVIAYDVQFTEPTEEREDAALYRAVSRARPVVLATTDVTEEGDTRVLGSTANVEAAGGRVGVALFPLSRGGVYRRVQPRVTGLDSFSFAAARLAGARTARGPDADGRGIIDYAGPPGTVATYSFVDVLDGRVAAAALRGRVVVVGVTALSEVDRHRTPTAGDDLMSGVEIQANAIATVLAGFPLRAAPGWVAVVSTLLLALLGTALAWALSARRCGLATLGALVAAGVGSYLAFRAGRLVEISGPVIGLLLGVAAGTGARHLRARAGERRMRALLARLAPDRDVDELLARVEDDELVVLGQGMRFGGYEVDRPLGVGGMGVVHLARQLATGRQVALKVMSADVGSHAELRERFLREARAAAALDHPAVIEVYDAGAVADRPYLAMQFVDGDTLHDLIGLPELSPARTVEILVAVADALDHAHARGVVHRDVKPRNVLVERDGRAFLADFGIAHVLDATRLTQDFVGTAAYTAPEQVRGEALTGACDQYALGCVLFECLTGRVPFVRDTLVGLMQAHLVDPPPPAGALQPGIGPAMDAVIARSLAKDPVRRYASCTAMLADAVAALSDVTWTPGGSATRRPPREEPGPATEML